MGLWKYGITLQKIANALEWFSNGQVSEVLMDDDECGTERFASIAVALLADQSQARTSPPNASHESARTTIAPGRVVLSADPHDDEGIAAAGILELKTSQQVFSSVAEGIISLPDHHHHHHGAGLPGSLAHAFMHMYAWVPAHRSREHTQLSLP